MLSVHRISNKLPRSGRNAPIGRIRSRRKACLPSSGRSRPERKTQGIRTSLPSKPSNPRRNLSTASRAASTPARKSGNQPSVGLMSSGLGLGEMVNRYAYSPIVHGIREAIDYVAPDSDLAKTAKFVDDEFYKHTVQIPAAQRAQLGKESAKAGAVGEVAHAVGTMAGDLPQIMLTGGLLAGTQDRMQLVNALRHGAAAMTVPAMRAGTDAAQEVKKNGGSEMEQFGAFVRGTSVMMGIGAVPMATKSGAATVARRVAERSVKSIPLASAAVESGRMLDNAVSDIFGGEKRPFSLAENIKGTLPMVLLGGVAGRARVQASSRGPLALARRSSIAQSGCGRGWMRKGSPKRLRKR